MTNLRFPARLPLLRTAAGDLQIGINPAIRIPAPAGAELALRALDGRRTLPAAAAAGDVRPEWLVQVVSLARREGLWPAAPVGAVTVVGGGPLAAATAEECRLRGMTVRLLAGTAPLDCGAPDVVILASGRLAPDPGAIDGLLRRDIAHLLLTPTQEGVRIGPFVVPGETCCQRCLDLVTAARSPGWATLNNQLSRLSCDPHGAEVSWAACLAARHAEAFLTGVRPDSADATWDLTHQGVEIRHWPRHPDCGCAGIMPLAGDSSQHLPAPDSESVGTMVA